MAVPEKMLGSFQMETSEGFDEFMYELGVNVFTRWLVIDWPNIARGKLNNFLSSPSLCSRRQEDCEQPLPPARDQDGRRPDVYWHIHQVDLLEKKENTTKVTITRPYNHQFQEHKDQVPVGHSMGGVHCRWENHSDYHHYWGQLHHQGDFEDTIIIITFSLFLC